MEPLDSVRTQLNYHNHYNPLTKRDTANELDSSIQQATVACAVPMNTTITTVRTNTTVAQAVPDWVLTTIVAQAVPDWVLTTTAPPKCRLTNTHPTQSLVDSSVSRL